MPIHDLGYRRWSGKLSPTWWRATAIAQGGIQVVLRNKWVRRVLLAAWLPTIVFGIFFFSYEKYLQVVEEFPTAQIAQDSVLAGMTEETPEFEIIQRGLTATDIGEGRHLIWSWLLSTFLRIPQAIMTLLVVGMIAPPLISRDIRSRAFLLYFSRPLNRFEYVLGKGLVLAAFLAFITMVPALGCYLFGLALSSDPVAILDTWDLPLRVVVASLIFIVPAVSVALMFSSLTAESRFAAFAWFATWGLGAIAWLVIFNSMLVGAEQRVNQQFLIEEQARQQAIRDLLPPKLREQLERQEKELETNGVISDVITVPDETFADDEANADDEGMGDERRGPTPPTPGRFLQVNEVNQIFRDQFGRQFRYEDGRMRFVDPLDHLRERERKKKLMEEHQRIRNHPLSLVSMYDTLVRLQRWVFGLETESRRIVPAAIMACLVTGFSWIILLRRVAAPIRV